MGYQKADMAGIANYFCRADKREIDLAALLAHASFFYL